MTFSDNGAARGAAAELQIPSTETEAGTDIESSSTVNGSGHQRSAESGLSCDSHSDAIGEIVLQAEQLAKGVREVARRQADRQTLEILAKAELKAREHILEPAAAQARLNSQEIIARTEREAEAILSGVQRLFGRASDSDYADDSSTVGGSEAAANGRSSEGPRKLPPPMSTVQRDQLKEVIGKRASNGH